MLSKVVFEAIILIAQLIAIFLEKAMCFWKVQNINFFFKYIIKNTAQGFAKKSAFFTKITVSESFIFKHF